MTTLYTEKEARRKYCPLKDNAGCVASYCMKWSWHYIQEASKPVGSWINPPKFTKTDKGYCNL